MRSVVYMVFLSFPTALLVDGLHFYDLEKQETKKPQAEVKVVVLKYSEFQNAMKANRGKVTVIYLWAYYSVPDRALFKDMVRLHKKYVSQGVIVVSLAVDRCKDKVDKIQSFIKSVGATFPSFILDGEPSVWQEELKLTPPGMVILDKHGRTLATFEIAGPDDQKSAPLIDRVDKYVKDLIQRK